MKKQHPPVGRGMLFLSRRRKERRVRSTCGTQKEAATSTSLAFENQVQVSINGCGRIQIESSVQNNAFVVMGWRV